MIAVAEAAFDEEIEGSMCGAASTSRQRTGAGIY